MAEGFTAAAAAASGAAVHDDEAHLRVADILGSAEQICIRVGGLSASPLAVAPTATSAPSHALPIPLTAVQQRHDDADLDEAGIYEDDYDEPEAEGEGQYEPKDQHKDDRTRDGGEAEAEAVMMQPEIVPSSVPVPKVDNSAPEGANDASGTAVAAAAFALARAEGMDHVPSVTLQVETEAEPVPEPETEPSGAAEPEADDASSASVAVAGAVVLANYAAEAVSESELVQRGLVRLAAAESPVAEAVADGDSQLQAEGAATVAAAAETVTVALVSDERNGASAAAGSTQHHASGDRRGDGVSEESRHDQDAGAASSTATAAVPGQVAASGHLDGAPGQLEAASLAPAGSGSASDVPGGPAADHDDGSAQPSTGNMQLQLQGQTPPVAAAHYNDHVSHDDGASGRTGSSGSDSDGFGDWAPGGRFGDAAAADAEAAAAASAGIAEVARVMREPVPVPVPADLTLALPVAAAAGAGAAPLALPLRVPAQLAGAAPRHGPMALAPVGTGTCMRFKVALDGLGKRVASYQEEFEAGADTWSISWRAEAADMNTTAASVYAPKPKAEAQPEAQAQATTTLQAQAAGGTGAGGTSAASRPPRLSQRQPVPLPDVPEADEASESVPTDFSEPPSQVGKPESGPEPEGDAVKSKPGPGEPKPED